MAALRDHRAPETIDRGDKTADDHRVRAMRVSGDLYLEMWNLVKMASASREMVGVVKTEATREFQLMVEAPLEFDRVVLRQHAGVGPDGLARQLRGQAHRDGRALKSRVNECNLARVDRPRQGLAGRRPVPFPARDRTAPVEQVAERREENGLSI